MPLEFDFIADDMEERATAHPIPHGLNQSMAASRFKQQSVSTHRKVLADLQNFIEDSKNKENQRIKSLKERQKKIGQQVNRHQQNKQIKRKALEEQITSKTLQECTFKPKINHSKGKRNFNEFIENQYAHSQKVKEKTETLKKTIEQKKNFGTYKPKINTNFSRKKASTESVSTVFQRLYSLSEKQKTEIDEPAGTFHPVINPRSKNMIRQAPVDEMLYGDALRRQEKGNQILQTSASERHEKSINYTNERYVAQKFIKQYFSALEDLDVDTSFSANIQYVQFNELLKRLGFVSSEQQQQSSTSSIERALVHDAYQLLHESKVNARNICVFMLGLIGIYHINPINFEEGESVDEEKEFNLDETDGRRIQRQFDLFFRNRLSSEATRRTGEKIDSFSFQPLTNKQSNEMAEKHRNNMLEQANKLLIQHSELELKIPEDGVISHTDLLVLNKMANDLKKQKMKEAQEGIEMKECTFKPNTFNNSLKNSKISEVGFNAGQKKSKELYEYHKSIKSRKDSLQTSRRDENDPECTFKPQINKNKSIQRPAVPFSKQTDETLYRLHKGRQQHEEKQKFFQRGEKIKQRKQSTKQTGPVPTLILDVNLGQKMDRIILYKGDQQRLEQVAEQFGEKHQLDVENKEKLLDLLRIEMENLLSKIEEDEESEEGDY